MKSIEYDHQFTLEDVGEVMARCLLSSGVRNPAQVIAYSCQLVIFSSRPPVGLEEQFRKLEVQLEDFLRQCYQHQKAKTEG